MGCKEALAGRAGSQGRFAPQEPDARVIRRGVDPGHSHCRLAPSCVKEWSMSMFHSVFVPAAASLQDVAAPTRSQCLTHLTRPRGHESMAQGRRLPSQHRSPSAAARSPPCSSPRHQEVTGSRQVTFVAVDDPKLPGGPTGTWSSSNMRQSSCVARPCPRPKVV